MSKKILSIGLDLDGVILYNPLRVARPLIASFKNIVAYKRRMKFYYPKTFWEKQIWKLIHYLSSLFVADGFRDIIKLTRNKKIRSYVVSARYSMLGVDFRRWIKKIKADSSLSGCYYNAGDKQPHLFKQKMIEKLNLDIYVEDNYDIVRYLSQSAKLKKVKIVWIYNILDRHIDYPYKFPTLKAAVEFIETTL